MSRPRVTLPQGLAFAAVTALTTWFALLPWRGFAVEYGDYLGPLLMLGLVLTGLGAVLRWLRFPVFAVPLVQLAVTALTLLTLYGDGKGLGPIPTPDSVDATLAAFADALESAEKYVAPIAPHVASIAPLLVASGAVAIIAVDLLAGGLGRVPLSGLVLLLVYTLPVTVWEQAIPWWVFLVTAAGFLAMLFLREDERFAQWGRAITGSRESDPSGFGVRTGSARGNAMTVGSVAALAGLVLPWFIPTLTLDVFGFGAGPGGDGDLRIVNPMTDLRRDLKERPNVTVITVTTDQADPNHLRYGVLTSFNGSEWRTGDRHVPDPQTADGQPLAAPEGVNPLVPRISYDARYTTTDDYESTWLPVPTPATYVDAPGEWKYDAATMDFFTQEDPEFAAGMTYTAGGLELQLDPDRLNAAGPPPVELDDEFTKLPDGIPPISRELALQITAGLQTDFQRAWAVQEWFRGPEGGFEYSLDAPAGNGAENLETFLSESGRVGYCEQFASAMAVMLRQLDIPARVATGFLRPDQTGPDTYVFSTKDHHAWVEAYFEGSGWVLFEPTPPSISGAGPVYTQGELPPPASAPSIPTASGSLNEDPTRSDSATAQPTTDPADTGSASSGVDIPWAAILGGLAGVALLVGLALVPRTLRRLRRDRRWAIGTAEAAWAELRDSVVDLGVVWPTGRSPRATGDIIAERFAAPGDVPRPVRGADTNPEAAEAMDALVHAVEVERYAPRAQELTPDELRALVTTCVDAVGYGVSERSRRRALWLPRSLRLGAGRIESADVESSTEHDQVVEHVGR